VSSILRNGAAIFKATLGIPFSFFLPDMFGFFRSMILSLVFSCGYQSAADSFFFFPTKLCPLVER